MKETVCHTSCLYCGKLVFDRLLEKCPKCGGYVVYLAEKELPFLGRGARQPVSVAKED